MTTVAMVPTDAWATKVQELESKLVELEEQSRAAEATAEESAVDDVSYNQAAQRAADASACLERTRERLTRARRSRTQAQLRELDVALDHVEKQWKDTHSRAIKIKSGSTERLRVAKENYEQVVKAIEDEVREVEDAARESAEKREELVERRKQLASSQDGTED